jgi:hypothetical protein
MVSEAIYKFFQALYDEETKRFAELDSRARLYFSIASLYIGAIAFKFDDVLKLVARVNVPPVFIIVDGAFFIVAVLFCVVAMQLRRYEGIANPYDVLETLQAENTPTEGEFFKARVVDYSVAAKHNSRINNRIAIWLAVSGFSILCGVAGQVLMFVYIAVRQIGA